MTQHQYARVGGSADETGGQCLFVGGLVGGSALERYSIRSATTFLKHEQSFLYERLRKPIDVEY